MSTIHIKSEFLAQCVDNGTIGYEFEFAKSSLIQSLRESLDFLQKNVYESEKFNEFSSSGLDSPLFSASSEENSSENDGSLQKDKRFEGTSRNSIPDDDFKDADDFKDNFNFGVCLPTTDNFDEVSMVSSNLYNIPPDELRKTPQLSRTNTESSQTFHRSHWTIGNPLTRRPLVKSRKSSKNSNISEISRKSHDFGISGSKSGSNSGSNSGSKEPTSGFCSRNSVESSSSSNFENNNNQSDNYASTRCDLSRRVNSPTPENTEIIDRIIISSPKLPSHAPEAPKFIEIAKHSSQQTLPPIQRSISAISTTSIISSKIIFNENPSSKFLPKICISSIPATCTNSERNILKICVLDRHKKLVQFYNVTRRGQISYQSTAWPLRLRSSSGLILNSPSDVMCTDGLVLVASGAYLMIGETNGRGLVKNEVQGRKDSFDVNSQSEILFNNEKVWSTTEFEQPKWKMVKIVDETVPKTKNGVSNSFNSNSSILSPKSQKSNFFKNLSQSFNISSKNQQHSNPSTLTSGVSINKNTIAVVEKNNFDQKIHVIKCSEKVSKMKIIHQLTGFGKNEKIIVKGYGEFLAVYSQKSRRVRVFCMDDEESGKLEQISVLGLRDYDASDKLGCYRDGILIFETSNDVILDFTWTGCLRRRIQAPIVEDLVDYFVVDEFLRFLVVVDKKGQIHLYEIN